MLFDPLDIVGDVVDLALTARRVSYLATARDLQASEDVAYYWLDMSTLCFASFCLDASGLWVHSTRAVSQLEQGQCLSQATCACPIRTQETGPGPRT